MIHDILGVTKHERHREEKIVKYLHVEEENDPCQQK